MLHFHTQSNAASVNLVTHYSTPIIKQWRGKSSLTDKKQM